MIPVYGTTFAQVSEIARGILVGGLPVFTWSSMSKSSRTAALGSSSATEAL